MTAFRCKVGALVVGPTRELCCQTHAVLQQLLSSLERVLRGERTEECSAVGSSSDGFLLRGLRLTGGSRTLEGDKALIGKKCSKRGLSVLCATPGRLLSLLELPMQHQVSRAASTAAVAWPPEAAPGGPLNGEGTLKGGSGDAASAPVQHAVPSTLRNSVVTLDYAEKLPFLFKFIQHLVIPQGKRCIVFCLTCQQVFLAAACIGGGISAMLCFFFALKHMRHKADAYEAFLVNRGVSLSPFGNTEEGQQMQRVAAAVGDADTPNAFLAKSETSEVNKTLQEAVQEDQALVKKGSRAFVSFIRAYKEHQLSFLLPFAQLNLGRLGMSMRLLRLPRMREIVGKSLKDFVQSDIDPATVPFKHDERRERERQQQLEQLFAKREQLKHAREKKKLQEQKVVKKLEAGMKRQKRTTSDKRQAKRQNALDEWNELAFEERMAKKLRRGRITEETYDRLIEKGLQEDGAAEDISSPSDSDLDSGESGTKEASSERAPSKGLTKGLGASVGSKKPTWALKRGRKKKRRR
ncbi:dead deah box helicase domain-containing protein [Cyclospora cayetanensis]|uniref:Dead deah box helicase domain-containing protein n=1 Tax=Cyclospora cayetanensis TaxID=88456 RepID=A0A1D3CWY8_9EIME|nr:dead deah box helicase domain-containing protein [Cyclospora cayetanensis]